MSISWKPYIDLIENDVLFNLEKSVDMIIKMALCESFLLGIHRLDLEHMLYICYLAHTQCNVERSFDLLIEFEHVFVQLSADRCSLWFCQQIRIHFMNMQT